MAIQCAVWDVCDGFSHHDFLEAIWNFCGFDINVVALIFVLVGVCIGVFTFFLIE
jgi:hypothetical protein